MKHSVPQKYFDLVAAELSGNAPIPGLWAKAYAETDGDAARARARYLSLRAQQLFDDELQKKAQIGEQKAAIVLNTAQVKRFTIRAATARYAATIGIGYWIACGALMYLGIWERYVSPSVDAWARTYALSGDYSYSLRILQRAILSGWPAFGVPLLCFAVWCWAKRSPVINK